MYVIRVLQKREQKPDCVFFKEYFYQGKIYRKQKKKCAIRLARRLGRKYVQASVQVSDSPLFGDLYFR